MPLTTEMKTFIIENVELIEQAHLLLDEVDSLLITNLGKFLKKIAEENGIFDICKLDEGEICLSRSKWGINEKGKPLLGVWLDCQGESTDRTWLSVLCGKAPGTVAGLFFWFDWSTKGIRRKDWKIFLRDFFKNNESLHEHGFILNDDGTAILKPFNLNLDCLREYHSSSDRCFEPLADAIDTINSQIDVFNDLSKKAKKFSNNDK